MSDLTGFRHSFKALTGNAPFPWQEKMYKRIVSGAIPPSCNLPTGLGKTSVIAIWLIALADNPCKVPRRLVYIVNRRTVVDQATRDAEDIRTRLMAPARTELIKELANGLASLAADPTAGPLAISTLRGQFADNGEWRVDPTRPAVVVGTVDMIGSRLLFSGYGLGFRSRPLHAGFLGQDTLLVHDEAHLEPAFQELLDTIQQEQKEGRTPDRWPLKVMNLTATLRVQGQPFELTDEEKNPPEVVPVPATKPIEVVWRRLKAKKNLTLSPVPDEKQVVAKMIDLALAHKDSGKAVLVFTRTIDAVEDIRKGLLSKGKMSEKSVSSLTGTMRGLERNRMTREDRVLARFYRQSQAEAMSGTVYLLCTSAGEVGVDMSADHLVCDLTPFDSMAQRFGRVNRFGDCDDTRIDAVYPQESGKKDNNGSFRGVEIDVRRSRTLELLRTLNGNASPNAVGMLDPAACLAAFTPTPTILTATDILFDAWAMTTIREKMPGRPPVEPYLHGISEWQPPETHVAWREEVRRISDGVLTRYEPKDLLDDYPLKPHELLRDLSDRVFKHLRTLAERHPNDPVWLVDDQGNVEVTVLGDVADKDKKGRIHHRTILLSPLTGGLKNGLLDGTSQVASDVADEWTDEKGNPRRVRVWDDDPESDTKTENMRRVRPPIDIRPDTDDEAEDSDTSTPRFWHWFERPIAGDGDGSRTAPSSIGWVSHSVDVMNNVERLARSLSLPDELKRAVMLAARFHDLGKRREIWQRSIGNPDPANWLAKSGKGMKPRDICPDYRHEFGSLLDVQNEPEFQSLSNDLQQLVLHLIAAHHGRGRPHFPSNEAFDPEPNGKNVITIAAEVPQRFARLQRRFGRWGLAYLESLLRAADWATSANPSVFTDKAPRDVEDLA